MSVSLTTVANSAAQYLGVIDSGGSLSTQQLNDALPIANDLLLNWINEQVLALQLLVQEQIRAAAVFIDQQSLAAFPLIQAYVLAGGTYFPPSYNAPNYVAGTAIQFPDLTTPVSFPSGYYRAFILALAVELAPQYQMQPSAALLKNLAEARAAANPMPGRIPTPGMDTLPPVPQGATE